MPASLSSWGRRCKVPNMRSERAAIRMVDAARRGPPRSNGRFERRYGETRIDRSADRIAHDPARPGIEDDRDIDEADSDRDVGDVGDPELVRPVSRDVLGKVGEDRPVMIAVSGGDEALAAPGLQVVFAHQTADLLAVDDDALVAQRGTDTAIAVGFELLTDRLDAGDDLGLVGRGHRRVVIGRAWQAHQSASLGDGETIGPAITDVVALLGRGALFRAPFRNSISSACRPTRRSRAAIFASYSCRRSAASASSS